MSIYDRCLFVCVRGVGAFFVYTQIKQYHCTNVMHTMRRTKSEHGVASPGLAVGSSCS